MRLLSDFTTFYKKDTVKGQTDSHSNCHDEVLVNGHTSLAQWHRLIRYVSAKTGQVRYGEPLVDSTTDIDQLAATGALKVKVLDGPSWQSVIPTDEEDDVRELLGPLTPKDVGIIRCTGLNHRSHSKSEQMEEKWCQTKVRQQFSNRIGRSPSTHHCLLSRDKP